MRILIVCLRRIGDVFVTTALARSFKQKWPDAIIDWVVYENTAFVLQNHPDASQVFTLPSRPRGGDMWRLILKIFMRYNLAFATQAGDRPAWIARVAAPRAYAQRSHARGSGFRNGILTQTVDPVGYVHATQQVLELAGLVDVPVYPESQPPRPDFRGFTLPLLPYVVIHPRAAVRYKQWTMEGWRALIGNMKEAGLNVACTGGSDTQETAYLDEVLGDLDVQRFDGQLSWPQLTALLSRAKAFVGIDTSVTHLAASVGTQTFAIFGPTDPRYWGPTPHSVEISDDALWQRRSPFQKRGNVHILQNNQACVPCHQEGCDRHVQSRAVCLDELDAQIVWNYVQLVLVQVRPAQAAISAS